MSNKCIYMDYGGG